MAVTGPGSGAAVKPRGSLVVGYSALMLDQLSRELLGEHADRHVAAR